MFSKRWKAASLFLGLAPAAAEPCRPQRLQIRFLTRLDASAGSSVWSGLRRYESRQRAAPTRYSRQSPIVASFDSAPWPDTPSFMPKLRRANSVRVIRSDVKTCPMTGSTTPGSSTLAWIASSSSAASSLCPSTLPFTCLEEGVARREAQQDQALRPPRLHNGQLRGAAPIYGDPSDGRRYPVNTPSQSSPALRCFAPRSLLTCP